jgi:hypothetical protein
MNWINAHFEEVLTYFFKTYKPKYLNKVSEFLEEFKGQELKCIQLLCARYFVDFEKFVTKAKLELNIDAAAIAKAEEEYKSLNATSPASQTGGDTNAEDEEEYEEVEEEVKKKSKLPLIIILLVVVLGAIAAYYFLFMGADDVAEEPATEQTEVKETKKEETLVEPASIDTTVADSLIIDSISPFDSLAVETMASDSI